VSIVVAVILVAVLIIFLITFQVRTNEAAIVYTFARAGEVITTPGLRFKLPYPIQKEVKYDLRMRIYEGKFTQFNTKDGHNLIVNVAAGWAINDPRRYQEKVGSVADAEKKLGDLVGGAANSIVNNHVLADFVSADPGHKYEDVERKIHGAVRADAMEQFGLDVSFLCITQLALPDEVTKEVFARIREERSKEATRIRAEGDTEAAKIRAEGDRQASEERAKAEAKATTIQGEGDKLAAEHFGVFKEDPELANFLRDLKALDRLRDRQTIILDTRSLPYRLLDPDVKIPGAEPAPKPPAEKPKN
jgi:membrane protease subunit HflC